MRQQFHSVVTKAVCHAVDGVLLRENVLVYRLVVAVEQAESVFNVAPRGREHRHHEVVATPQGERGRVEKHRVQRVQLLLILFLLSGGVRDNAAAQAFKNSNHGEQAHGGSQIKDRVRVGDDTRVYGLVPETVEQSEAVYDRHAHEYHDRLAEVEHNIDNAHAAGVGLRADRADNRCRHAVAEIDTDDNRVNRLKCQQSRRRKGLQNAHGRRRTL